jgi:S1-C subfamily serine protease
MTGSIRRQVPSPQEPDRVNGVSLIRWQFSGLRLLFGILFLNYHPSFMFAGLCTRLCASRKSHQVGAAALIAVSAVSLAACVNLPRAGQPDFVEVIRRASPAVVAIGEEGQVVGSGFRLAETRLVVTAAHVVNSVRGRPDVVWNSMRTSSRIVQVDVDNDLALLELDMDPLMPGLQLASGVTPLAAGEWIVVLGCPFGGGTTATMGIVSAAPGAVLEPASLRTRIQINAAVNPGNSGGPVVNLEGRVLGIASATVPGGFGIAFAVPTSALAGLLSKHQAGP